jgi:hypothetical protein
MWGVRCTGNFLAVCDRFVISLFFVCRCVKLLQLKTFRVFTGHTLSALGSSAQSMDILSALFPQLPADEEETPPEGAGTKTPVPPATGSPRGGPVPRAPLPPEPAPGKGGKPPTGATKRVPPGTAAPKPVGKRGQPAAPAGRGANAASPAPPAGDAAASSASNKERLTSLDPASATPLVQRRARPPPTVLAIGGPAQKKRSKPHTFFVAANTDGTERSLFYLPLCRKISPFVCPTLITTYI